MKYGKKYNVAFSDVSSNPHYCFVTADPGLAPLIKGVWGVAGVTVMGEPTSYLVHIDPRFTPAHVKEAILTDINNYAQKHCSHSWLDFYRRRDFTYFRHCWKCDAWLEYRTGYGASSWEKCDAPDILQLEVSTVPPPIEPKPTVNDYAMMWAAFILGLAMGMALAALLSVLQ